MRLDGKVNAISGLVERIAVVFAVALAVVVFMTGTSIAVRTGDPHWVNRAGALIVCVETIVVFIEFARRRRFHMLEQQSRENPYFEKEASRAERQLVFLAIAFAVFGEFLHGFGDLLLELVVGGAAH
jgi:hypothetical protein